MTDSKKVGGINRKLHLIQADVPKMEKGETNTAQGYNYLSEGQITELFKGLLEKHGVIFTYSSTITDTQVSPSGKQLVTDVQVDYEFIDLDTGEKIVGFAAGQGADSTDKGVYKAITGAIKYIFMKTFLIPTGDDPEKEKKRKTADVPFGGEEDED